MSDQAQSSQLQPSAELVAALIKFQQSVPTIHDNDNSYHGGFANLPGILSTIGPKLRENGLAVSQLPEEINGQPGLRTTLLHVSGQNLTAVTPLAVNAGKNGTQEWGKAMTYSRRYALQAVLGLCVGIEDNDADMEPEPARTRTIEPKTKPAPAAAVKTDLTPAEKQTCIGMVKAIGLPKDDGGCGKPEEMKKILSEFRQAFEIKAEKVSDGIQTVVHQEWIAKRCQAAEA
nr:putative DNA single-strand annealing protein SSAP [uncultured Mediterranean phage uvMED]